MTDQEKIAALMKERDEWREACLGHGEKAHALEATVSALTRKLEEAKGALTEIGLLPRGTAAFSLECAQEIASDALASLSPEQPEKPEAVETGEPVAWENDPYCQGCNQEQKHCGCTFPEWGPSPYDRGYAAAKVKYASPVSDGEARRKALETSLRNLLAKVDCIRHWHDAMEDGSGMVVSKEAVFELWEERDRALAAIPTAGDAPALAQPKRGRPIIDDEAVALRRLGDGGTIGYSQDGEDASFREGDQAWVADDVVMHLRDQGFLIRKCDDEEDYRGLSSYDAISPAGRAAIPTAGDAK